MRLVLLDKNLKSSREALSIGTSYQSALRYNDTIRDRSTVHTDVEAITTNSNTSGKPNGRDERNSYRSWNTGIRNLGAQPLQSYRGRINNINRRQRSANRAFYQRRNFSGEARARGNGRIMNRGNFINQ